MLRYWLKVKHFNESRILLGCSDNQKKRVSDTFLPWENKKKGRKFSFPQKAVYHLRVWSAYLLSKGKYVPYSSNSFVA